MRWLLVLLVACSDPSPMQKYGFVTPGNGFVPPTTSGGGGGAVTNGAANNVVTKSDGANLVASSATDNGTTFAINTNKFTVTESSGNTVVAGTLTADSGNRVIDTAGTGLAQTNNSLAVNISGASCSAGNSVTAISATGGGTCSANVSSVVAGTSISATTTNGAATVNVNATPATCTNGQGVTSISAGANGTCGDIAPNTYGGTHLEWNDDFIYGSAGGGTLTLGIWGGVVNGSGATAIPETTATTTRPGIWTIGTGTTATGRDTLQAFGVASVDFGSGLWTFEATVGFQTLSTSTNEYSAWFGFGDVNTSANQTDGCFFVYDRGNVITSGNNSGNASDWEIECTSNTSRTVYLLNGQTEGAGDGTYVTTTQAISALSLPDTNWYRLKIVEVSSSQFDFYVNGVKSGQIETHIPTGSARTTGVLMGILQSSNGAAATRTADIDQTRIAVDLNAARNP